MGRLISKATIGVTTTINLSEIELAALEALAGYGDDAFLETFYNKIGQHYLKPHEAGIRSLFASIRDEAPSILKRGQEARNLFIGK